MSLGLFSHHRGCMSKSSVADIPFLYDIMMSRSENGASLNLGPDPIHCYKPAND